MKKLQLALAALAAAGSLSLMTPVPAYADGAASTRNIILGAAAIAGIAIESNVARKNAQADAVTGYLRDGSRVYGDGHVVTANGYSYYPGDRGQNLACDGGRCSVAYAGPDAAYSAADGHGNSHGNANYGDPNYRGFGGERRDRQPGNQ